MVCLSPFSARKIPGTHFCQRLSWPQGHSVARKIRWIEKPNDLIGNLTRDFPACSIVPQPTTLLCALLVPLVAFLISVRLDVLATVHIENMVIWDGTGGRTNVSKEPAASSNFRVEDRDNRFYRNVGVYLTNDRVLSPVTT
jgi:hypothetical protein